MYSHLVNQNRCVRCYFLVAGRNVLVMSLIAGLQYIMFSSIRKNKCLLSLLFSFGSNNLFGFPFRIPKQKGESLIKESFNFFDMKGSQQNGEVNKLEEGKIRMQFVPFYGANINNVETTYQGQYGITTRETYTTMKKDSTGSFRPVSQTRHYTVWFPTKGTLPSTSYSYLSEPTLRIYSDFILPRRMAEKVVSSMDMVQQQEKPRQLTKKEVDNEKEVIMHKMKVSLAKELTQERLERLEQERAKRQIKKGYTVATDARVRKITIKKENMQINMVKLHMPIFCTKYCSDPPMFKIVNGFSGQLKGHSLLHPEKITFAFSILAFGISQLVNEITTIQCPLAVLLSGIASYSGVRLYNYLKIKQIDQINDEKKKNDDLREEINSQSKEFGTNAKIKIEKDSQAIEKKVKEELQKHTPSFQDLKQSSKTQSQAENNHPKYQASSFIQQKAVPSHQAIDPADIILSDQDCKLFNMRMGKRYSKKQFTEHFKKALSKYQPPEYKGNPAIAEIMKKQLTNMYEYNLKRRGSGN